MAEHSKIEWTDHIDKNAAGRQLEAYKSAAKKVGCSLEECNVGLGQFADDLDLLKKAVSYLEAKCG